MPNPIDLPGLHNLNFRPGVVVPVLAGILLGPIAGFAVGAAGTLVADGLTFGISWNWAIGNGLIGLIAGLVPAARLASRARWRSIGVATVISALAIILGIGFAALTDVLVANLTPDTAIGVEWISVVKVGTGLGRAANRYRASRPAASAEDHRVSATFLGLPSANVLEIQDDALHLGHRLERRPSAEPAHAAALA